MKFTDFWKVYEFPGNGMERVRSLLVAITKASTYSGQAYLNQAKRLVEGTPDFFYSGF